MLNMNEFQNTVADNTVAINGTVVAKLTDSDAKKVIGYIRSLQNGQEVNFTAPAPAPQKHEVVQGQTDGQKLNTAKTTGLADVTCKWTIEEIITPNNKKFYRITDGIFTAGKWMQSKYDANKEFRIPVNQEAHRLATTAIKGIDNIQSVEMNGGWKAYGFTSKRSAEAAIKKLPAKISKVAIADYIAEHGLIKAKAVTRSKVEQ